MKKIILIAITLLCLVGCGKRMYTIIYYSDFMEKIENKDSFVLVLGSDTCGACAQYKITMEDVMADKKVEVFYLGIDKLTSDEYSKIYSKYVITSTPTTIFFKDGEETSTYDRLNKAEDYSTIVEALEKHGYIGD